MGSAHGELQNEKKGRIGAEVIDRETFKLPFVPIFFYFPIHWVRFRSSFLVLVRSVAMSVNTGSNLDPVIYFRPHDFLLNCQLKILV